MRGYEWFLLTIAIVTDIAAWVILIRALSPTERLHVRKMRMLDDLRRGLDAPVPRA